MTPLATIRNYDDLHRALRARAEELRITRTTLDDAAGFTPGHASKLLAPRPIKRLGPTTWGLMLQALGVQLVMVEDAEALKRITPKLVKRQVSPFMLAVKNGRGKHHLVSKRFLRKIASKGGHARARRLNPSWRRGIARKAAIVRWQDVKKAVQPTINGGKNGKGTGSKSKQSTQPKGKIQSV